MHIFLHKVFPRIFQAIISNGMVIFAYDLSHISWYLSYLCTFPLILPTQTWPYVWVWRWGLPISIQPRISKKTSKVRNTTIKLRGCCMRLSGKTLESREGGAPEPVGGSLKPRFVAEILGFCTWRVLRCSVFPLRRSRHESLVTPQSDMSETLRNE